MTASKLHSAIAVFSYNRFETFQKTIDALKKNKLAKQSQLYIFSDGPKNECDLKAIQLIRDYAKKIEGFNKIHYCFEEKNKGLAKSIIEGVSYVLENTDTVIVLEDDLVASTNFLKYMNMALIEFRSNPKVFSISGYSPKIKVPVDYLYDNYFTKRSSSWGWATWQDRWEVIDWEVSDYKAFAKDKQAKREFNRMGSDMAGMLKKQMSGKINSWAIRWCYHQFRTSTFTVYPIISKIQNVGFGEKATHTTGAKDRFYTELDTSEKVLFHFDLVPQLNSYFLNQFVTRYSFRTRAYYKLLKIFKG